VTLRFLLDEDVSAPVAAGLRARGIDAVSVYEIGRSNQRISDPEQLQFAVEQGRVLVTYNRGDFQVLDALWQAESRPHSGILWCTDTIVRRPGIGELIRALSAMSEAFDDLTGLCLPLQRAT
jgi:predicted nuclease of predicted toxin-antitoxin system